MKNIILYSLIFLCIISWNVLDSETGNLSTLSFFTFTFSIYGIILVHSSTFSIKNVKALMKKNISLSEMDISVKFADIYRDLVDNNRKKLEEVRKDFLRTHFIIILIILLLFCIMLISCILFFFYNKDDGTDRYNFYVAMSSLNCFVLLFVLVDKFYKRYYIKFYKENIISTLITKINDSYVYENRCTNVNELEKYYANANFIKHGKIGRYKAEDYIYGKTKEKSRIHIADVYAQTVYADGILIKMDRFNGMFTYIQTTNNIDGEVRISKNKKHKRISEKYNKIEIEGHDFEKYFDVKSEDRILAIRLITPEFIEALSEFYKYYEINFDIVIRDDCIYIRFYTGDLFEPLVWKKSMDLSIFYFYYKMFELVEKITRATNKALTDVIT